MPPVRVPGLQPGQPELEQEPVQEQESEQQHSEPVPEREPAQGPEPVWAREPVPEQARGRALQPPERRTKPGGILLLRMKEGR